MWYSALRPLCLAALIVAVGSCSGASGVAGEASCDFREGASYKLLRAVARIIYSDPLQVVPALSPEDAGAYFDARTERFNEDLKSVQLRDLERSSLSPAEVGIVEAFEKENQMTPCATAELKEALWLFTVVSHGYANAGS